MKTDDRSKWLAEAMGWVVAAALVPLAANACEPAQVVSEVERADDARYTAMRGADMAALGASLGDDLVYTHSSSVVDGKQSYMASIASGKVKYKRTDRSDLLIRPIGCTAIVTGRGAFLVELDGKDITVDLRFTNVWTQRNGTWQMVAWQATRIPPKN